MDSIAVLDFGSQYSQLIARRVREANVYCEVLSHDVSAKEVRSLDPKGFILSGGPASVYESGAPRIPAHVLDSSLPILGICYGMQALTHELGGKVAPAATREYGSARVETLFPTPLLTESDYQVWMSHGDRIERPPEGFNVIARSDNSPAAAIVDPQKKYYGLQFHPEVQHTPRGANILRAFAVEVCGTKPEWFPASIVEKSVSDIRSKVGNDRALAAVSGGVDSSVAATLVHHAIGEQLSCVFVNNGLMRKDEPELVAETFTKALGAQFRAVDASERFLDAIQGVIDPEEKRKVIGETFIRVFEEEARHSSSMHYLVQGTIYPDVIESRGPERQAANRIKTHHNVGGLPADMQFDLIEPLRLLFKDEVRAVGEELGLPRSLIHRQPFPGPGLAVRCLGEVTLERIMTLRLADQIVVEELESAGILHNFTDRLPPSDLSELGSASAAQAFAVLLPVRSVGVMGDKRTYREAIAVRAVSTEDFMTADWTRIPDHVLAHISNRIVNEVPHVNRVVYDISSKPPATIEWE